MEQNVNWCLRVLGKPMKKFTMKDEDVPVEYKNRFELDVKLVCLFESDIKFIEHHWNVRFIGKT